MIDTMTSRERMMTALRNGQSDRIPAAPDISNMIPCRLTGKPFWEIYINESPPLWQAYLDAVRYYGMDGWFTYGDLKYKKRSRVEVSREIIGRKLDRWGMREVFHTPDGDLEQVTISPIGDAPTHVEKMIKDFKEDFPKFRHLYSGVTGCDAAIFQQQKKELGDLGMMCTCITPPGFHHFVEYFQGNLEAVTYAYYDYPELFEELRILCEKQCLEKAEIAIDQGIDSILTGGSGSITLQSPEIWRELSLPTIKKITRMCREAGVISGIHSCGKERYMVEVCALETDLDYINPLEIPPMGDCSLKECKEKFGQRLALMGNLHTTDVMLLGTPEAVKLESLKAIRDAGINGGFVLSTGDQCGRDTPDVNIFTMVGVVKEFGRYPLDIFRIEDEIRKLERML